MLSHGGPCGGLPYECGNENNENNNNCWPRPTIHGPLPLELSYQCVRVCASMQTDNRESIYIIVVFVIYRAYAGDACFSTLSPGGRPRPTIALAPTSLPRLRHLIYVSHACAHAAPGSIACLHPPRPLAWQGPYAPSRARARAARRGSTIKSLFCLVS